MKKIKVYAVLAGTCMMLAGCGGDAPTETTAAQTTAAETTAAQSETTGEGITTTVGAVAETPVKDRMAEYVGMSLAEFVEEFGEPEDSAYQDSCLVEGAQDGFLTYGEVTVVTLLQKDGTEVISEIQ